MAEILEVTLPNGFVVKGTIEQIKTAAAAFHYDANSVPEINTSDVRYWHYSESKGQHVRIKDMATRYLRNACLQIMREHYDLVAQVTTPKQFVLEVKNWSDLHLAAMLYELSKRDNWTD